MPINQYHLRVDRLFPKINFNLGIHENIGLISNDNTNILRGYDGMMSLLNGREGRISDNRKLRSGHSKKW